MKHRVSSAHVLAIIAIVLALGGNALAFQLGKNSVGSKQLKKNAVLTAKIKKEAVTGAKIKKGTLTGTQVNASTLGTVPSALTAQTAQTANALAAPEAWHVVGAPGEPPFQHGWKDDSSTASPSVAFFKDHEGIVHLRGDATGGEPSEFVFQLPPGFRPAGGQIIRIPVFAPGGEPSWVQVNGVLPADYASGGVAVAGRSDFELNGVSFRAEG